MPTTIIGLWYGMIWWYRRNNGLQRQPCIFQWHEKKQKRTRCNYMMCVSWRTEQKWTVAHKRHKGHAGNKKANSTAKKDAETLTWSQGICQCPQITWLGAVQDRTTRKGGTAGWDCCEPTSKRYSEKILQRYLDKEGLRTSTLFLKGQGTGHCHFDYW